MEASESQPDTRTLPHQHPSKAKMGAPDRYSFLSEPVANPEAIVTGSSEGNSYRFTILTSRLLRYEWSPDGGFEDRVSTLAFFRNFEVPTFAVVESKKGLEITTAHFKLTYNKKEFSPQGLVVKAGDDVWRYDGKSYGDLGGTARTLDNVDGRIPLSPGILSKKKTYAVIDDSNTMVFEKGWIATRQPGRKDGYLFAYNGDHKAAIKAFYRLSGKQPVLPRWTLGNWWSRYHEYSDTEYITLMNNFRKAEVPLSVAVIDMDWHKVNIPEKYGSGWTGYSWNRDLFPDPEGFLRELHKRGLKVTVNDHPADGIRAFEDLYPEVAKAMHKDPSSGEPIPFDCTDKTFLNAYFDVLKAGIEKQGIDFWWVDWQQGDKSKLPGVDPLWVLNHYHYLTSKRNVGTTEQPITFSRYAGPGSHRYPIGFSGDSIITWASLQFQPEFTATASNIGYGWWSHDIGGHMGGSRSNELTARWVQLGCFSPILRLHSEKNQWNSKEPWNWEPETAAVMKEFLVLRHRLIPYLYTMNICAHEDDEPLIQPMYWNHSSPAAYTVPNQYTFGPNLIVAPITTPHNPSTLLAPVTAWLPEGRYVDLFHPTLIYDGGRHMHLHRPLSEIPVLAPQGTIVVLDATPKLPNGVSRPTDLEIVLVVGTDASFTLVEEPEPDSSEYVRTPITWNQQYGRLSVGPASSGPTRWRNWRVKLVGHTGPRTGRHETHIISRDLENRCTTLDFGSQSEFTVYLGDNLQLDVVDIPTRVHEVLHRCEMGYWLKEQAWLAVTDSEMSIRERVKRLRGLEIEDAVKDAIMEVWAADGRAAGSARGLERWAREGEGEESYVLV